MLLIAFNRPDLFERVLDAVRRAEPRELFISIDGPRAERPDDVPLRAAVLELASRVDWAPDVHLKVEDNNLGCGLATAGAVTWALEHVEEIITFDDDCLPDPSFLYFCDDLLERYAHDERVMQIGATNWGAARRRFRGYSYAFTSFAPVWGWATWRRAWALNDFELRSWPRVKASGLADGMSLERRFLGVLKRDWDMVWTGGGTWDYQWQYSVLRHHGLSVCPARNLVVNIGNRPDGTQLREPDHVFGSLPLETIEFPLVHPPEVARNTSVESVFGRLYWQKRGWPGAVFRWLVRDPRLNRVLRKATRRVIGRPS